MVIQAISKSSERGAHRVIYGNLIENSPNSCACNSVTVGPSLFQIWCSDTLYGHPGHVKIFREGRSLECGHSLGHFW